MAEEQKKVVRKIAKGRHLSAFKRARQTIKREARNQFVISTMRTYVKHFRQALAAKDKKKAEEQLKVALPYIAKAANKGAIHSRTAARYTSRLTRALNAIP